MYMGFVSKISNETATVPFDVKVKKGEDGVDVKC